MKNNLAESDAKVGEFMSSNTIKTRIQLKNDTEANWNQAQNFIPKAGEVIIYSGDNSRPFSRLKVGDGRTVVTALPFIHSGVMSINGLEPNISGNFELSAAAIGLNKPLNIVGFLANPKNPDLTTGIPITDIPSITGLASYVPKEGDVVLDSRNGVEFACIQIETIETIDEETEEKVEETFYLWKQLGKNAAAVFQKDLTDTLENHNYPITFSPRTDATDTTDKILKDIYFNFNPVNKNLTIGSDSTPGTINGKPIGSAMSKDFIDYNYEVFPTGLNYKGIATNISSGYYNTYTLENEEHSNNAEHGDLVYLNSAAEENSGYYIFHLKDPINTSTWDKIVAKNIGQSDKLITERLLYYYEGNSNISKLGVIIQGTWNGNIVDVAHGGTGVNSFINNGILYAGIENNATVVKSGIMSWGNWVNGTSNGPTITLKIGDVANPLQYTLPAIPIATNDNSGVITTTAQDIKGVKTFTSAAIGLRCVNTKLNQILFGTENLSDSNTGDQLIGNSEFASINVKMPFNTTQFSFRQFKINNSEENGVITYSKHSYIYEEYLLPEINNDITSTKTYNILTTKSLVTVAEGGTGQSSFDANKILYGNGNGPIQSEIPEWKAWVAGTTAGPQAVFHIGGADYTSAAIPPASTGVSGIVTTGNQSFSGRKTFTGLYLNLTPETGEGGEIHLNASTANTTQAGIVLDQFESKFRIFGIASADGETINGVGTPLVIDPYNKTITGGYTLTGSLTGHASLDLPLTGGIVTGYISLKTNYNASLANNGISSGAGYPTTFNILDSAERIMVRNEAVINSNGSIGSYWYVRNYNTSGTQVAQKGIGIYMAKDGTLTYGVSDPAKFRAAIGTWALVADNNGYGALTKADGTYGWVKIGNPDGSLGLLPGVGGSAGSGHNYIGTTSWYWKYAYIDEIHGSLSGNASTATKLSNTPNNTTTFLRGDNSWSNTLTGNLTVTNGGMFRVDHTGQGAKTKGTAYGAFYLAFKNSANSATYAAEPIRYVGTDATDAYNTCVILGSNNGTTWVGAGESSGYMPGKVAYNDENLYLSADGSVKIYTSCANDGSSYSGPVTISGTTITANLTGNVTGNCSGSSGSCTGHAASDLALSGGTMTGDLLFADSGTTTRQIRGIVGANDYWRVAGGATASNAGWMEIATADDGNEPIYVRQYTGAYTTIKRTLTLLDANGYMLLPSYINVPTSNSENPTVSQIIVTNGNDSYYRKASTAHVMAAIRSAASGSWGISVTGNAATATRSAGNGFTTGTNGIWPSYQFYCGVFDDSSYSLPTANTWSVIYATIPGKRKSDSGWYANNIFFRLYSHNGAGTRNAYYEDYYLPNVNTNRTNNVTYSILTTKSAITVAQGGTGATSAANARTNLGLGGMAVKAALLEKVIQDPDPNNNGNLDIGLSAATYVVVAAYLAPGTTNPVTTGRVAIPWVYYSSTTAAGTWEVKIVNASGTSTVNTISETKQSGLALHIWYYTK